MKVDSQDKQLLCIVEKIKLEKNDNKGKGCTPMLTVVYIVVRNRATEKVVIPRNHQP